MQKASVERDIGKLEGMVAGVLTAVGNVASEVSGLRADFNALEQGRLSKLELEFARFEASVGASAKSAGAWWGIAASIAASMISGLLLFFLLR